MTMLEKAARAAADVGLECGLSAYDGSALWDAVGIFYMDIARAVLMAVREPGLEVRSVSRFSTAETEWTAMIDAILNEGPSNG